MRVDLLMLPSSAKPRTKGALRKNPRHVSAPYEDSGLFKARLVTLMATLYPVVRQNTRRDFLVKAQIEGGHAMEVVFAGRRAKLAQDVLTLLRSRSAREGPATATGHSVNMHGSGLGLKIRIHGAWRPRFIQDEEGWETRQYHFIAAEWEILQANGSAKLYGLPVASVLEPAKG